MKAYTQTEVKEILKKANGSWESFIDWMRGQTCPLVDGEMQYYALDVDRYIRNGCDNNLPEFG